MTSEMDDEGHGRMLITKEGIITED